jgi:hypothetical protein
MRCPECKSSAVYGLVAAFWVRLEKNGDPTDETRWESESEVGPERACGKCAWEGFEDDLEN